MHSLALPFVLFGLAALLPAQANDAHSSKLPPAGPPWMTDFAAARSQAIAAKKPIFVYSTKTYCPHCVAMEQGLLSSKELAADYGDVVWMYLFQDFSRSDADRAAERVAIRFGISSWPQHFLVDPFTLAKVADTGRSLRSFRAAVQSARVTVGEVKPSSDDLAAFDALAVELEQRGDVEQALLHLKHADRVVAFRALQLVAERAPERLIEHADWLLSVPNDQIRGLACDVLAVHGSVAARDALHAIVRDPGQSQNPNVLRIRAVKALARCGDDSSLPIVEPFAASGQYRNSLTATAVRTVVAIAGRQPQAKVAAVAILAKAYPPVPGGPDAAQEQRLCEALAKEVHAALRGLTGKEVAFPPAYTEPTRAQLMQSW